LLVAAGAAEVVEGRAVAVVEAVEAVRDRPPRAVHLRWAGVWGHDPQLAPQAVRRALARARAAQSVQERARADQAGILPRAAAPLPAN